MLFGPWLGCLLCLLAGVARPVVAAHRSTHSPEATARWLAFFACTALLVLPFAALPVWMPLRHEAMLTLLLLLGAADARGADALHRRYVAPLLGELLRPLQAATQLTADVDALLDAVEQRVQSATVVTAAEASATAADAPSPTPPPFPLAIAHAAPDAGVVADPASSSSDGDVLLDAETDDDAATETRNDDAAEPVVTPRSLRRKA